MWSWDGEELKPQGVRFTAKVFRTSTCLADLFASSLEPQSGQAVTQLWSLWWENMGSGWGKLSMRVGQSVTVLFLSNLYNVYIRHKQLSFSHLLCGQKRGVVEIVVENT